MKNLRLIARLVTCWILVANPPSSAEDAWVVYDGKEGPGNGKHMVLIGADDEYRSEQSIPQLARILATHHGFKCTVLFPINRVTGEIDPLIQDNIPGLDVLKAADLLVMFLRFRDLPDDQMQHILDYANSGKPMISLRTNTHPFNFKKNKTYEKWDWRAKGETQGGFGRQVFGETWVSHYGVHQKESTRAYPARDAGNHPILRGVEDVWGPSDVYGVTILHGDCKPVLMGQVLVGMQPTDAANTTKKLLPIAWTKTYMGESGKIARVFTTTMGHVGDFENEGFRRVIVNACYWLLDMDTPANAKVDIVGRFQPTPIGFGKHIKGVKPADLK